MAEVLNDIVQPHVKDDRRIKCDPFFGVPIATARITRSRRSSEYALMLIA